MSDKFNVFQVGCYYIVHQNKTMNVLKKTRSKRRALAIKDRLDNGSGFQDFIPDFFINKDDCKMIKGGG